MVGRPSRSLWLAVAALLLAMGCSWTVPVPRIALDAASDRPADAIDVAVLDTPDVPRSDTSSAMDTMSVDSRDVSATPDLSIVPDTAVDAGSDAGMVDTSVPVDARADTSVMDLPSADVGTDGGGTDVSTVVDGGCMPGDTRGCYTAPIASENVGACRDGVQTCDATGVWGSCVGEIVPDCVSRVCGSDECGSSCGTCPLGNVCNDAGQCVALACGEAEFIVNCTDGTTCPTGSMCAGAGNCTCMAGYIAVDCDGDTCAPCTYPNWLCVPSPFCGEGEVVCDSGAHCPRHSGCDPVSGACLCNAGYTATTCGGTHCTSCTGTDYDCQPLPPPM